MRTPRGEQNGKTSELNSQVLNANPSKCETEVVIAQSLRIAKRFHSMIAFFEVHKPWIIELRNRFEVSQGQAGKTLNIEGDNIYWRQFVENYFNVSLRWMNELLGINEKATPSLNPKPDEEKPLYQRGYQAGRRSVEGVDENIGEWDRSTTLQWDSRFATLDPAERCGTGSVNVSRESHKPKGKKRGRRKKAKTTDSARQRVVRKVKGSEQSERKKKSQRSSLRTNADSTRKKAAR
jgi:hypothetical protein